MLDCFHAEASDRDVDELGFAFRFFLEALEDFPSHPFLLRSRLEGLEDGPVAVIVFRWGDGGL